MKNLNNEIHKPGTYKFDIKFENYYEALNKAIEKALKLI